MTEENKSTEQSNEETKSNDEGKQQEQQQEQTVPYYKFKKVNDTLSKLQGDLDKINQTKQAEDEAKAKANGEFEKLLADKNSEVEKLAGELTGLQGKIKQGKIDSLINSEISKENPQDADVVLSLINKDIIEVIEGEDGSVNKIKGITKEIERLKKEKPYLFKDGENSKAKGSDNGRPTGDNKSLQDEFQQLIKDGITTVEQQLRVEHLGAELKKQLTKE